MMMTQMTTKQTNLVERKKLIVKGHPQDDDANQLSEENPCVKKYASLNNMIYYLS
jgi:hypothetical protein